MAAEAFAVALRLGCAAQSSPSTRSCADQAGVRQGLSEGGNGHAVRRRAIGDGLDNLWRQKRERDKSADMPLDQTFGDGDLIKGRASPLRTASIHPRARTIACNNVSRAFGSRRVDPFGACAIPFFGRANGLNGIIRQFASSCTIADSKSSGFDALARNAIWMLLPE
jgi:hypothetical protein